MIYAILDGEKINPTPKTEALCPQCGEKVISKCGKINTWHWAHESKMDCDDWSEGETEWHAGWKRLFPEMMTEVVIEKNGKRHRADALLPDGSVVEFQHSPISVDEIREREEFYGRMTWVFDVSEPYEKDRLFFRDKKDYHTFRWLHARKHILETEKKTILDFSKDGKCFLVKKIYKEAGCRGWGKMIKFREFVKAITK